jgi:hypothetical protein
MKPKIYFDIGTEEYWAQKEWESLFTRISSFDSRYSIAESRKAADFVVATQAPTNNSKFSKFLMGCGMAPKPSSGTPPMFPQALIHPH